MRGLLRQGRDCPAAILFRCRLARHPHKHYPTRITLFTRILFIALILNRTTLLATDDVQWVETATVTITELAKSIDQVPEDRKAFLDAIATDVRKRLTPESELPLTFICTHNSRRSHLAQVWAQVAAAYYGHHSIQTYSGGTEATACNIRTVRSLRRSGLQIVDTTGGSNPRYLIQYAENCPAIKAFSKVYDQDGNPESGYVAMMCCSDADEKCPIVRGSVTRFSLNYIDPKVSDDTSAETATYDERSTQIGREMFYLFSRIAQ